MKGRTTILIYFLSLIASYMVYWLFSLQVSLGLFSLISLLGAVMHFGISSWLFLFYYKAGRMLSFVTGGLTMAWPVKTTVNSLLDGEYGLLFYYLLPVVMTTIVILLYSINTKPDRRLNILRITMAVVPFLLFLIFIWFVTTESIHEGALNINL